MRTTRRWAAATLGPPLGRQGGAASTSQGHPRTIFRRALEHDNLVLAEVTAREIGRVTIAGPRESEEATLEDVAMLAPNLRSVGGAPWRGSSAP
jgi:hypothetical protein